MVPFPSLQSLVPIVLPPNQSKGDFIGEIVKGSFRLSFQQSLSPSSIFAFRIKYKEYEKKATFKTGLMSKISDSVSARVLIDSDLKARANFDVQLDPKLSFSVCPQVINRYPVQCWRQGAF